MALSRQAILAHSGVPITRLVHVPAWKDPVTGDDSVNVRGMSVREFELQQAIADKGVSTATLVSWCVVDEQGSHLFEKSDIRMIAELPLAQLSEIVRAITDLSGLTEPDEDDEAGGSDGGSAAAAPADDDDGGEVESPGKSPTSSEASDSGLRAISG